MQSYIDCFNGSSRNIVCSTDKNVGFGVTQTGLPSCDLGQDTSLRTCKCCGMTEA